MAATNIGKWSAQAVIDTAGVTAGANKAIAEANRVKGALGNIGGAIDIGGGATLFGGGKAIAFAAAAVATGQRFAQDFTQTVDDNLELGFLANRLGTSVESLSTLQTVARESNISTQSFASGMDRLNMRLGEASLGGEEAQRSFRRLGLEWQQLTTQGFDKNLMAISQAFLSIENRSERARLAQEIFGRGEGQRMLRLMEIGAVGLAEAMADVRTRGGFITADQLSRLQAADDAFDRMTTASANGWRNFVVAIAPAVTGVLNEWNRAMAQIDRSIVRLTAPSVATRAQQLLQSLTPPSAEAAVPDAFTQQLGELMFPSSAFPAAAAPMNISEHEAEVERRRAELGEARIALHDLANEEARRRAAAEAAAQEVNVFTGPTPQQQAVIDAARLANNHLETATNNAAEAARQLAEAESSLASAREREQLQQQARNRERIAENQRSILRDIDEADRITEQGRTPLEAFGARMERLQELFESGNLTDQAFARATRGARGRMLGDMFGNIQAPAPSPLLGSLSAGSSEAAAVIQGAMNPQVDQLSAIVAGIQAQQEELERTREIQEQLLELFENGEIHIAGLEA